MDKEMEKEEGKGVQRKYDASRLVETAVINATFVFPPAVSSLT